MPLKKHKIEFEQTKQFSQLFIDYINKDGKLHEFYDFFPSIDSFKNLFNDNLNINRTVLVEALNKQYKNTSNKFLQKLQIDKLNHKNTFTVCTGHQLCIYTGPLYFIFKIISTINLSETLKKQYPEYNFIPMYWMASEDHDFEEISSINIFGKEISWKNESAKGSVGKLDARTLNNSIEELKQIFGESENANELVELFTDAYLKHSNLADATRYIVHRLFGEYGLLIIDADDKALKQEFASIIEDDIINNSNYRLVNQTVEKLNKLGFSPQVNPREINCFYTKENIRERIEKQENAYAVLNTDIKFSLDELKSELKSFPERFSPNVVLRPMYQQLLLPNIAYVGGPGEIAYWLEYKEMFKHHAITFPILVPRNFAIITDDKTNQQIEKLGFTINDFFKNTDELNKEFLKANSSENISIEKEENELKSAYTSLIYKAEAIDTTLKNTVEAELQKALNGLKSIESKFIKAEKQKQESSINQIKKIKNKFLPEGILQERYENFSPYYLMHGKQLIPKLKEQLMPFDFKLNIIEL